MSQSGSVTGWIGGLKGRDDDAAQKLWERFFRRLVGLARTKLRGHKRRAADEEDIALSAFDSFFRGAERGQFPLLHDRDDLWHLLVTITVRKAADYQRDQGRQKRGGDRVLGESALQPAGEPVQAEPNIDNLIGHEPTPAFAAQVAEECRRLLDSLGDGELRSIALNKMEGYSNEEIAEKFGCVTRTIERRLKLIRKKWQHANAGGSVES